MTTRHDAGAPSNAQRRTVFFQMIESGDNAAVYRHLEEDKKYGLPDFRDALRRYSSRSFNNFAVVDKLLSAPVLDQSSGDYKSAVTIAFMEMAANDANLTGDQSAIADKLFEKIKNDQEAKDESLAFVFQTAVSHGSSYPNAALAKKLINHGADLTSAFSLQSNLLEAQKRNIERQQSDLLAFKGNVMPRP